MTPTFTLIHLADAFTNEEYKQANQLKETINTRSEKFQTSFRTLQARTGIKG